MSSRNDKGDQLACSMLRRPAVRSRRAFSNRRSWPVASYVIACGLLLTVACGGKAKSKVVLTAGNGGAERSFRVKTVFAEPFDTLDGWSYTPDSPSEAVFHIGRGLLTVGSYGAGALPSGPRIVHVIPEPLHTDSDSFIFEVVLFTSEGGRYGRVSVSLLDKDQVPAVTMAWEPGGTAYLVAGGLEKSTYRRDLQHPFSGKLSVWHIGAKYSLRLNDGPELTSIPVTQKKVIRYVKIEVVRTESTLGPPDVKIDLVRLQRIVGVD